MSITITPFMVYSNGECDGHYQGGYAVNCWELEMNLDDLEDSITDEFKAFMEREFSEESVLQLQKNILKKVSELKKEIQE